MSAWTQGQIQGFHDIFSEFYEGPAIGAGLAVMGFCTAGTTVDDFAYTPLDGSSGAFHIAGATTGGTATDSLPAQNAAVITIRTADRGRQNRGRVYLPPFAQQYAEGDGQIDPAVITGILTQLNAVAAAVITGASHLGVGSYGPYVGAGSPHFTPANAYSMDNLFDVQRRRKS